MRNVPTFQFVCYLYPTGACVCKTGFISPDCSVKKTTPPQAMVAKRGCADGQCFATVMGMGFVESEKLNCVMQEVEVRIPDGFLVQIKKNFRVI